MPKTKNWRTMVYKIGDNNNSDKSEWKRISKNVILRDKSTCYRCKLKFWNNRKKLSVHHITPRPIGTDDPCNLITLCNSCHDIVEMEGCKTLSEIENSYYDDPIAVEEKPIIIREESFTRPEWHAWVYGGARRN